MLEETNPDYLVWGPETCPDTGKPHFQCYVYYENQRSIKAMQKRFNGHRCVPANGDAEDSRKYIIGPYSKNGKEKPFNPDAVEVGTIPKQGKRNDIAEFRNSIRAGKRDRDIDEDHPDLCAKYPKYITFVRNYSMQERAIELRRNNTKVELHIRWGQSGTGKTRYVWDRWGEYNVYTLVAGQSGKHIWWDNYQGEDNVVINEFDGQIDYDYFLQLLDNYPMQLAVKGGHVWKTFLRVYVTSNVPLEEWWPSRDKTALIRRITSNTEVIRQEDLDGVPPEALIHLDEEDYE